MTCLQITRRAAFALPVALGLPVAARAGGSDPIFAAFADWL